MWEIYKINSYKDWNKAYADSVGWLARSLGRIYRFTGNLFWADPISFYWPKQRSDFFN